MEKLLGKLGKMRSRKFWVTVTAGFVVLFAGELGIELTSEQVYAVLGIVGLYDVAQGAIDYKNGHAETGRVRR